MEHLRKRSYICSSKSALNLNKKGGGGLHETLKNFISSKQVYLLFKTTNIIHEMSIAKKCTAWLSMTEFITKFMLFCMVSYLASNWLFLRLIDRSSSCFHKLMNNLM